MADDGPNGGTARVSPGETNGIGQSIARAALLIAVVTVLARAAGFARVIVFARTVGPSCLGDTYFTANTVPNIVFDIVAGGALSSLVVPLIAPAAVAGDRDTVGRTASALLTWAATLLIPVMVLGMLFTHPLMRLLVGDGHPGCSAADEVAVGARMLAVFMPQVVIYAAAVVLIGVLQGHRRFLGPALGPLVSSLVMITAYGVFAAVATHDETGLTALSRSHELVLSVGTTLGVASLVIPMLFPSVRIRLRLRPSYHFPPGVAARVRRMALSGALVLGSQDLATAVVLRLANDRGTDGAVVLYNLAWTVFTVPWAVAAVPLATSAYPGLSAAWQSGARAAYAATLARTARVMLVVVGAAAAVMAATATPVARVVILGAPGHVDPNLLTRALITFAVGLPGYALVALLSRSLYAQGNNRTPATAALGGWLIAIALDIVLAGMMPRTWTVAAIGIGTSVGVTVTGCWLLVAVARSAGASIVEGLRRAAAAGVAGAGVAGVAGWLLAHPLTGRGLGGNALSAIAVGAATVVLYVGIAAVIDRGTVAAVALRLRGRRG
ncbi:MAG TPA: lipid II flippase MurJ [Mycobacteriales bacterium]|nr:lipid II flippase MurJ [Mycobacteriales bacterium]HVX68076.1 lipid II flippase MurJ [Mycobacteriales bacterium]